MPELRQPSGNFDTFLPGDSGKFLIPISAEAGIQIAHPRREGSRRKPWVFDPPPLVATFGRSEPVPVFFVVQLRNMPAGWRLYRDTISRHNPQAAQDVKGMCRNIATHNNWADW